MSNEMKRRPWAFGVTGALMLSGCLSINGVALQEGDASVPTDGDDGPIDGDPNPIDGDDAGAPPCFDRGTYEVELITLQGSRNACDGELVCVDGACVEEPDCAPGVTSACKMLIAPRPRGRTHLVAVGDDFYWLDSGEYDALGNRLSDPSLMRVRAGVWTPEQVGATMSTARLDRLLVSGGYLLTATSGTEGELHAIKADGSAQYAFAGDALHCVTDTGVAVLERAGTGTRRALIARELVSGEERELAQVAASAYGRTCLVHGSEAAFQHDRSAPIQVFDVTTGESHSYGQQGYVDYPIRFDGESILQRSSDRAGTAPLSEDGTLEWTWLRRLTWTNPYGFVSVQDDQVTWARFSENRKFSVILRGNLSDQSLARVLTEMPTIKQVSGVVERTAIGSGWVAYGTEGGYYKQVVHFVPIEPN